MGAAIELLKGSESRLVFLGTEPTDFGGFGEHLVFLNHRDPAKAKPAVEELARGGLAPVEIARIRCQIDAAVFYASGWPQMVMPLQQPEPGAEKWLRPNRVSIASDISFTRRQLELDGEIRHVIWYEVRAAIQNAVQAPHSNE